MPANGVTGGACTSLVQSRSGAPLLQLLGLPAMLLDALQLPEDEEGGGGGAAAGGDGGGGGVGGAGAGAGGAAGGLGLGLGGAGGAGGGAGGGGGRRRRSGPPEPLLDLSFLTHMPVRGEEQRGRHEGRGTKAAAGERGRGQAGGTAGVFGWAGGWPCVSHWHPTTVAHCRRSHLLRAAPPTTAANETKRSRNMATHVCHPRAPSALLTQTHRA